MSYVPPDWAISGVQHVVRSHRVGFIKRVLTCTCGCFGHSSRQLWAEHVARERSTRAVLERYEAEQAAKDRARQYKPRHARPQVARQTV